MWSVGRPRGITQRRLFYGRALPSTSRLSTSIILSAPSDQTQAFFFDVDQGDRQRSIDDRSTGTPAKCSLRTLTLDTLRPQSKRELFHPAPGVCEGAGRKESRPGTDSRHVATGASGAPSETARSSLPLPAVACRRR